MRPTKLTPADLKRIAELYCGGLGLKTLATQFRIRSNTIKQVLRDAGVGLRSRGETRMRQGTSTEEINRLYTYKKLSIRSIARLLKINQKTVVRRLRLANVERRSAKDAAALRPVKHGMTGTPEYVAYWSAKNRCTIEDWPTPKLWMRYGGRGIKFLFISFDQFFEELGPRPSPRHSLDRYPNRDGNYEPGNVRWATTTQQANNKEHAKQHGGRGQAGEKNHRAVLSQKQARQIKKLYYPGKTSQQKLADQFGVSQGVVSRIVRGIGYKEGT